MVKFTVYMAAVLYLVKKYRFVNDSKIKIGYILQCVLAAVSLQENKQTTTQIQINWFFFSNEYALKQWTAICIPYRKVSSSEFTNCNDQIINAYFYFRVFLCILTNILAYMFEENESALQIGLFYFILIVILCYFMLFYWYL